MMNEPVSLFVFLIVLGFNSIMFGAIAVVVYLMTKRIDKLLSHEPKQGRSPALTEEDIAKIKVLLSRGVTKTKIARIFNVSRKTLYNYLKEPNE
jgi:transposase